MSFKSNVSAWLQRLTWRSVTLARLRLQWQIREIRRRDPRGQNEDLQVAQRALYEQLRALDCEPLLRKARKLRVRIPAQPAPDEYRNEWWDYGVVDGEVWLTQKGWDAVRDAVREEEKYRREVWAHRREWLTIVIGILGAAAAFVSALVALHTVMGR